MGSARYRAVIFDLDGVITQTVGLHARAWKRMFDKFLRARAQRSGEAFRPFDLQEDYLRYVDGKPRLDGVRSFLASRNLALPEGQATDPPMCETVGGLGNRKNELFGELLQKEGVQTYPDALEQLRHWKEQGLRAAVVTSSRNGREILERVDLAQEFDAVIEGSTASRLGLAGKPAPDTFLEAARQLGVEPPETIVLEDAISGVAAGRAGGFGLVVGVNRNGAVALREHGADLEVRDIRELGAILAR